MTLEQFDAETCRLRWARTLAGDPVHEVAELVSEREEERARLLAERERVNDG